jgi:hypothetical protein
MYWYRFMKYITDVFILFHPRMIQIVIYCNNKVDIEVSVNFVEDKLTEYNQSMYIR